MPTDAWAERVDSASSFISKLSGGKAVLTFLFGVLALLLYTGYENRAAVATQLASNIAVQISLGVGTLLLVGAWGVKSMFNRIEELNQQNFDIMSHYKDAQLVVAEQRLKDCQQEQMDRRTQAGADATAQLVAQVVAKLKEDRQ